MARFVPLTGAATPGAAPTTATAGGGPQLGSAVPSLVPLSDWLRSQVGSSPESATAPTQASTPASAPRFRPLVGAGDPFSAQSPVGTASGVPAAPTAAQASSGPGTAEQILRPLSLARIPLSALLARIPLGPNAAGQPTSVGLLPQDSSFRPTLAGLQTGLGLASGALQFAADRPLQGGVQLAQTLAVPVADFAARVAAGTAPTLAATQAGKAALGLGGAPLTTVAQNISTGLAAAAPIITGWTRALSGGGALSKGEIGSMVGTAIFPGVGTLAGGIGGTLLDLFGGDDTLKRKEREAALQTKFTGDLASHIQRALSGDPTADPWGALDTASRQGVNIDALGKPFTDALDAALRLANPEAYARMQQITTLPPEKKAALGDIGIHSTGFINPGPTQVESAIQGRTNEILNQMGLEGPIDYGAARAQAEREILPSPGKTLALDALTAMPSPNEAQVQEALRRMTQEAEASSMGEGSSSGSLPTLEAARAQATKEALSEAILAAPPPTQPIDVTEVAGAASGYMRQGRTRDEILNVLRRAGPEAASIRGGLEAWLDNLAANTFGYPEGATRYGAPDFANTLALYT